MITRLVKAYSSSSSVA